MPRLNIEESFWSDPRTVRLAINLSNEDVTYGMLLRAFRLAQKFWCNKQNPKQLIPKKAFENEKLMILVDVNWAQERENGYYIHGVDENFNWWFENEQKINDIKQYRKEAGSLGGRISAQRPRNELGQLLPSKTQANPSSRQAVTKENQASSSSSSSSSSNTNTINTHDPTAHDTFMLDLKNKTTEVLNKTYFAFPELRRTGKQKGFNKILTQIKSNEDLEKFRGAVNNYFSKAKSQNIEAKYYKQFITFVNQWRDYINEQ